MTGIDFSPVAIAEARRLAASLGTAADFACAELYDARAAVIGHFDIVYTTWGTICWLPDMNAWARIVASLLTPGGFLNFADAHPHMLALEERDGRLFHAYPLDTPPDRPLVFDTPQTYSGDPTPLAASRTYEWIHSPSRLINALLGAGLALEFLNEHAGLPWPPFPMCMRGEDGLWRLPDGIPAFPLSLSLRARKPSA